MLRFFTTFLHALNRQNRYVLPTVLTVGFVLCLILPQLKLINSYQQYVLVILCINIMLCVSLNLLNGFLGEFSVGHAGFMAIGAYSSALVTMRVFPQGDFAIFFFPVAVFCGALFSSFCGFLLAIPSFRTRGDYLAIVTLAFMLIIKSGIENLEVIGGARGLVGIDKFTGLASAYCWTVAALWMSRNFIFSAYGRGVLAVREDELAALLMGVNTKQVKILTFVVSAFFAGAAGGLFAHQLQFVSPGTFDILKSTEIIIMVYLGGAGSISGSIIGAVVYTLLLELLRPLGSLRMAVLPLLLVLLMIFRPSGIMGYREFRWLLPWQVKKREG